ncbi:hypothetical protein [Congregibacter sp.]|jgi:hypothetical protein|uniref:hypothetical protein n=1 Tax=Congregibacter sp. TaxID=2744308 RepID=UPI0039E50FC6
MQRILQSACLAICCLIAPAVLAGKPIVTDEFDRILITGDNTPGDVLGQIELVASNPLPTTWSLERPVPYGDQRNYLRPGQLDATEIVTIDAETGEIRLKRVPAEVPAEYYAEVRAHNDEGYMEQVLIIITRQDRPAIENALDIFTQRNESGPISFYATNGVDPAKLLYAANIANALLMNDRRADGRITAYVKEANAVMTLFETFEERNEAIDFYMHSGELPSRTQDLQDEEIIPDYLRLGGPSDLRRDASVEEITHLIHGTGIKRAYPGVQRRLEHAVPSAVARGFWTPQDGLPRDAWADEYLIYGLDIYYGVHVNREFKGVPLTAENLASVDPELYDIVAFLFPDKDELFRYMDWLYLENEDLD